MRIFDTIGRPELKEDERFATNDARVVNREELDAIIGAFIQSRTLQDNLDLFEKAAVTVGPVYSVADLVDHPYIKGREVLVPVEDADMGEIELHNVVPRLSRTPGALRRPAPALGEHTQEVLEELFKLEAS